MKIELKVFLEKLKGKISINVSNTKPLITADIAEVSGGVQQRILEVNQKLFLRMARTPASICFVSMQVR